MPFLLIIILISRFFLPDSLAATPPQRRRGSGTVGTNLLDSLGILPESVKAILVLHLARNVSKARAGEIEAEISAKPDHVENRLTLIGYYSWNGRTDADRMRLRTHVVWFVENHPEHAATQEPALRDLPDDREGNALLLAWWEKHLESRGDNLEVLKNAEKFFFSKNPAQAEEILYRLAEKEPLNEDWPRELALLYRMFGVPNYAGDRTQQGLEAYRRVLGLTRNPASRESLSGNMAEAAFKAGDLATAAQLAEVHLASSDRGAIHLANTILGRIALRSGDIASAKQRLIDSSQPAARNHVSLWGPAIALARELLEEKEQEAVLQYFENCLTLWPRGEGILMLWISDIKSGRVPNFGKSGLQ